MSIFLTLLEITVPVFLVIGAGYACVRTRFLADAAVDHLVAYQIKAAVPALLFLAMYRVDLGIALNPSAMAAFFGAGTVAFFATFGLSRGVWRRRPGEAVAVGFCAFFPNAVMLGIPISQRAYGDGVMGAVFGIIAFHSLYNWLVGFMAMEAVRRDSETIWVGVKKALKVTFSNPLMIGLLAGMAVNISGTQMPGLALSAADMLAASALPVALFALGGVLTRYRVRDEIGEALMVSVFSLIVHPGLAWVLSDLVFGLPPDFVRATVLIAAMPTGINSYIFAAHYDRAVSTAANAVLIATILSLASITGWLWFLGDVL